MPGGEDLREMARRILEFKEGTAEREAYIERLAEQVRNGTYHVDSHELAAKLLDHLLPDNKKG